MKKDTYLQLCSNIKKILIFSSDESEDRLRQQKVRNNWYVGQSIEDFLSQGEDQRVVRGKTIERLSKDLDIQKRFIQDLCRFYRVYLKVPNDKGVFWTHYQHLITIEDAQRRKYWQRRISKDKIGCKKFEEFLYDEKINSRGKSVVLRGKLQFVRGCPYIYRIIKINFHNSQKSEMVIDCGFHIDTKRDMNKRISLQGGFLIKSEKTADGYEIRRTRHDNKEKLYTYKAGLKRVVDGDTLDVHIDVGFNFRLSRKLRLRGVDTPELGTPRGSKAKQYVERKLKGADFLIIKSYGMDMYGRYVVDVFYDAALKDVGQVASKGKYLNQELLDQGLAELWK